VAVDWDGTATERDTLDLLLSELGDPAVYEDCGRRLLAGAITYRELMETEMATVRLPVAEAAAWLVEHVRLRPGLRELVAAHEVTVLSSGFHELIEPVLAREEVDVPVVANRVEDAPRGWRVLWRDEAPCPECDDVCKRRGLPSPPVVYVGDGYSDRCAALAAARVFARDGLARYLDTQGVQYEPFEDLLEVAEALQ
jgi:2-hydroxy-3-keto-5-methylthiopentenyl-1-phosphate phosphatase